MFFRKLSTMLFLTCLSTSSIAGNATAGKLYFTQYGLGPNIGYVNYLYDGSAFSVSEPVFIAYTDGGDGIAANPQNPDMLMVGGADRSKLYNVSISTGAVETYDSPSWMFHLEVPDSNTVYGAGLPSKLVRHTINADGSINPGQIITLTGDDTEITQLITTPVGYYYTSSFAYDPGTFGKLEFTGETSAVTTRLVQGPFEGPHGGVYDPLTNNIIVFGKTHIVQIDLDGNIVSDLDATSLSDLPIIFDQGTVDGNGHLFVASNVGQLVFVDYGDSGLVADASNYKTAVYVYPNLDDVAPLVGPGSTSRNNVAVDIKPTSCPNPINTESGGLVPVAILGSADFDVTTIDISTIMLNGIAPRRTSLEDVATPYAPFVGKMGMMDCNTDSKDGYTDLTMKFNKKDLVDTFGAVQDGDVLVLPLTGALTDGTGISGEDVIVIRLK